MSSVEVKKGLRKKTKLSVKILTFEFNFFHFHPSQPHIFPLTEVVISKN